MSRTKGRLQLLFLMGVFFLPVIAAVILVSSGYMPGGVTTNHGTLVQPAEQLDTKNWEPVRGEAPVTGGLWQIVVPFTADCGEDCQARLDLLTRARVALDRSIDRVLLVSVQPPGVEPPPETQDSVIAMTAPMASVNALAQADGVAIAANIVDYRGYHVMRYAEPLDAAGLLDDLEKLLRLAKEEAERRAREEALAQ